jgi:hypothetical protein
LKNRRPAPIAAQIFLNIFLPARLLPSARRAKSGNFKLLYMKNLAFGYRIDENPNENNCYLQAIAPPK